jgi:hypothetical protein
MLNWELFQPRNLFVIAAFSVAAFWIYKHFSTASEA